MPEEIKINTPAGALEGLIGAVYSDEYTRQQKVELMDHIIETFQKLRHGEITLIEIEAETDFDLEPICPECGCRH
jgi:hypothetical protein